LWWKSFGVSATIVHLTDGCHGSWRTECRHRGSNLIGPRDPAWPSPGVPESARASVLLPKKPSSAFEAFVATSGTKAIAAAVDLGVRGRSGVVIASLLNKPKPAADFTTSGMPAVCCVFMNEFQKAAIRQYE